jgi:Methyltransferase domain
MNVSTIMRRIGRKLVSPFLGDTDSRTALLSKMPRHAVCAEIGVWKGGFSERILKMTEPRELNLIDPWVFQSEFPDRMFGGKVAKNSDDMEEIYQDVRKRLGSLPNVAIHRGFSGDVLKQFKDGYFDWIYIDGNHYYDFVRKDLELAYVKVKPGGYITGDDYTWGEEEAFPVKRAVQDFVKEKSIETKPEVIGDQFIIMRP